MTSTKLTKAASNRKSLRTTVPKEVVQDLELKDGDSVEWEKEANSYRVTKRGEAGAKRWEADAKRLPQIEALHKQEHPDCPWNGKTIFPKGEVA